MMQLEKRIQIPSCEFQKNELQSIYGILGNDIFIHEYHKIPMLLPNGLVLIDVKYEQVDFNTFDIYLVSNPKQFNVNSDKYIVTIDDKYVQILKPSKDKFYIKLHAMKYESMTENDIKIHYYGLEIKKPKDVLHNFCSIFGMNKLSYHGNKLKSNIKKYINPLKSKINIKEEMINFKNLNVINKDYTNSYINMNSFKLDDLYNDLEIITLKQYPKSSCIIDFENSTFDELYDYLKSLKKGYIILTDKRCPTSLIYIKNNTCDLTETQIYYTLLTINLDLENLTKWCDFEGI